MSPFNPRLPLRKADNADAVPPHALLLLQVTLPAAVPGGVEFVVRTVTVATPTDHILEGMYYDYTPAGCPRTIISQCQQYGFQRIVPCIDYMAAKMYYTTTIIGARTAVLLHTRCCDA
jgi:aminopeptidase N